MPVPVAGWQVAALSVTFCHDNGFYRVASRGGEAAISGRQAHIMAHVVVVGAGIAGVPAAYSLKDRLDPQDRVTVISDRDYFHFVPSNPWVAMGWRQRGEVAVPIGPYLAGHGIDFLCQPVQRIEAAANQIHLANGGTLEYDFLLLATGPKPAFEEIEGIAPQDGLTHSILHIEQAVEAFAAYRRFLESPGPVVVGIAQNASTIGPAYEFAFLVDADLRRRNMRDRVPITVVTPEPFVGHLGLGGDTTRRLLESALRHHGIDFICNARTLRVTPGQIHIAECDARGREQKIHTLPFAFSVYWPPFRGVDAVAASPGLADERGFVEVDEYLRSTRHPNVLAVGLCRSHGVIQHTPVPVKPPESVYSIQNDVATAVTNIVAASGGGELTSAVPRRAHWLNDMGESGATSLTAPQIPLRDINWLKKGWWVHMAKVEFEKYFLDRIKLKPAPAFPGWNTHVATALARRQTQPDEYTAAHDVPGIPTRSFKVPLEHERALDLKALARALGLDANTLAGELLNAAILDAQLYLNDDVLAQTKRARRELLAAGWPEDKT